MDISIWFLVFLSLYFLVSLAFIRAYISFSLTYMFYIFLSLSLALSFKRFLGRRVVKIQEWLSLAISKQAFWLWRVSLGVPLKISRLGWGCRFESPRYIFKKSLSLISFFLSLSLSLYLSLSLFFFFFSSSPDIYFFLSPKFDLIFR